MKPISPRPFCTLSFFTAANHKRIKNWHYVAFSTQAYQSPVSSHHSRRHEEESRSVRVSVWWDFENCNLPLNTNVFRVAHCITNAVRANGIKGPIQITAFGDVMQMSRTNQEALSSTGINLTHVPSGGKNSADRSLLLDLMHWVSQNPPPAHLFLISGDRDFAGILHRLRMNNYNILLASPDSAPSVLCSAATIMWQWSSLLKGENLTGKLFNQPPDGPYNSWYGHYKAPLEDPFTIMEQSSRSPPDESSELVSDTKFRPIPKAVTKHIRQILNSYPEGISIAQLRSELAKSNLTIDKDLYGYRKFSRFLLAMPHILKLHSGNDGQFLVQGGNNKSPDESVRVTYVESATNNGDSEVGSARKPNGETSSGEDVVEKPTVPPVLEPNLKSQSTRSQDLQKDVKQNESSPSTSMQGIKVKEKRKESSPTRNMQETREQGRKVKLQEQPKKDEVASSVVEIEDSSEKNENRVLVPDEHSSASGSGIFRRIWMKWFGSGDTNSTDKGCLKTSSGKDSIKEKTLTSYRSSKLVRPPLFSPSSHEALSDAKIARTGDDVTDESSSFSRTMNWFKFWSSPEFDDKVEKNGETGDQVKVNPKKHEMFSKESFWNELESFINTSEGAATFCQSKTREHLVQNLQKHGPPVLRSLPKGDLLHLVDLLISDKEWVEECDSQKFPFRLILPSGKDSSSNGLSHIFCRQPNSHESRERKQQNPPYTGVPQPLPHRSSSSKSRDEILADCQKLVDDIVKEYPEGFNMGSFRKLFLEKNGYALDLQKLGYGKLVNLLQIMPGMKMESNLILPATFDLPSQEGEVSPIADSSISSTKKDDNDSSWDELGPVDNSGHNRTSAIKEQMGRTQENVHEYEPLSEDYLSSDSEEETSSMRSENKIVSKSDQDSTLLQILDSWYSNKGGDGKKDELMSTTITADRSDIGSKNESPVINPRRKQKFGKSYSFVTEEHVDSKDKLVDGILGSLKKSGEKSAESRILS